MKFESLNFPQDARVVVLGVGSGIRGDDAAGVAVVEKLKRRLDSPNLLALSGGSIPENFTSKVKGFNPSHILLIDATDFGGDPGAITLVNSDDIADWKISTHRLPLSVLMEYLQSETGAEVILVGIQPAHVRVGTEVSVSVGEAIDKLAEVLTEKLGSL